MKRNISFVTSAKMFKTAGIVFQNFKKAIERETVKFRRHQHILLRYIALKENFLPAVDKGKEEYEFRAKQSAV